MQTQLLNQSSETGTVQVNPPVFVEVKGEPTGTEAHLREELRIANAHLVTARQQVRELAEQLKEAQRK